MNERIILFKLLVHWILCQMLSDIVVVCSSDGSTNDFFKAGKRIFSCSFPSPNYKIINFAKDLNSFTR